MSSGETNQIFMEMMYEVQKLKDSSDDEQELSPAEEELCLSCKHQRVSHRVFAMGHHKNLIWKCIGDQKEFCSCPEFEEGLSQDDIIIKFK